MVDRLDIATRGHARLSHARGRALTVVVLAALCAGCERDDTHGSAPATGSSPPETSTTAPASPAPRAAAPAPTLDTRPLAGQAEIGVRAVLGNPSSCDDVAKGRTCRYAHASTDITYIDGMADWIALDDLGGAPFSAAALARVGLPTNEDPVESSAQLIRWQNIGGYREVTLYPAPDGRAGRIEMKRSTL